MISYVTIGTNNKERTAEFYDALLGELGAKRAFENERLIGWGTGPGQPMLAIAEPYDKKDATIGNGGMVAISAKTPDQVDVLYAKAIELGGTDEGPPGDRGNGFYGGYFRDLDGNKLVFAAM